jgi:hypothetical protein
VGVLSAALEGYGGRCRAVTEIEVLARKRRGVRRSFGVQLRSSVPSRLIVPLVGGS